MSRLLWGLRPLVLLLVCIDGPVQARPNLDEWLHSVCASEPMWHEPAGADRDVARVSCYTSQGRVADIFVLKGANLAGAATGLGHASDDGSYTPRFHLDPPMGFGARHVVVRHGDKGLIAVGGDNTIGPLLSCDDGMDCADRSMLLRDLLRRTDVTLAPVGTWSTLPSSPLPTANVIAGGALDRRVLAKASVHAHDTLSIEREIIVGGEIVSFSTRLLTWFPVARPQASLLDVPWRWVVRGAETIRTTVTRRRAARRSAPDFEEHLWGLGRLPAVEVLGHCHFPTELVSEPDGTGEGATLTYCLDVATSDIDRLVLRDAQRRVLSVAFRVRAADLELPGLLAPIPNPRTHDLPGIPGFSTPPRFPAGEPRWVERRFRYHGQGDAPVSIDTLVDGMPHGPAWWLGPDLEPLAYATWDEGRLHGRAVVFGQGASGVSVWKWFVEHRAVHVGQLTTERNTVARRP